MTVQHLNIPEAQLHESKGVSTAAVNKHYVANGTGSGVWQKILPPELNGITTNGTLGQQVESDGAGGFRFNSISHGAIYFNNYTTPFTVDVLVANTYLKAAPTTIALGDSVNITEATTARLTYTGTLTGHFRVLASISLDQTSGADRILAVSIFKNGVLLAQSPVYVTAATGNIRNLSVLSDSINTVTNDYFEVWVKNITGLEDIRVYGMYLTIFSLGNHV